MTFDAIAPTTTNLNYYFRREVKFIHATAPRPTPFSRTPFLNAEIIICAKKVARPHPQRRHLLRFCGLFRGEAVFDAFVMFVYATLASISKIGNGNKYLEGKMRGRGKIRVKRMIICSVSAEINFHI
jgi:hypothetical protein